MNPSEYVAEGGRGNIGTEGGRGNIGGGGVNGCPLPVTAVLSPGLPSRGGGPPAVTAVDWRIGRGPSPPSAGGSGWVIEVLLDVSVISSSLFWLEAPPVLGPSQVGV